MTLARFKWEVWARADDTKGNHLETSVVSLLPRDAKNESR